MSVRKRGGRWMVDVEARTANGVRTRIRRVCPHNTKRAAQQYETQIRQALASGSNMGPTVTVADFAPKFLEYQVSHTKPLTVRAYEQIVHTYLLDEFGHLCLDEVSSLEIDAFKMRQLRTLSAATVNKHLAVLGRMLSLAKKWGLIQDTPTLDRARASSGRFEFFSFDEAERVLSYVKESEPQWYLEILLCMRTGLRVGELSALEWADVDLERKQLYVRRTWCPAVGFGSPKNGKVREIPLSSDLLSLLRERAGTGLVCPNKKGLPQTAGTFGDALKRICTALSLKKATPHTLRHTFASHAVMKGVPLRVLQDWMGHADIRMTLRYAHLADGIHADLINRLST